MKKENNPGINFFQRYLTVWMFLCMVVRVLLGHFIPALPALLNRIEYARISVPIAILIWVMIYPMMFDCACDSADFPDFLYCLSCYMVFKWASW